MKLAPKICKELRWPTRITAISSSHSKLCFFHGKLLLFYGTPSFYSGALSFSHGTHRCSRHNLFFSPNTLYRTTVPLTQITWQAFIVQSFNGTKDETLKYIWTTPPFLALKINKSFKEVLVHSRFNILHFYKPFQAQLLQVWQVTLRKPSN